MQRWLVIAVIGAILMGLGGGYALYTYRRNLPDKVWVPFANLNPELTQEQRENFAGQVRKRLLDGSIMTEAVKDTGLAAKLGVASDAAAEEQARKGLFVLAGEVDTPTGRLPSINVGFDCQRKTHKAMGDLAVRLMEDVWKMLGINPPDQRPY